MITLSQFERARSLLRRDTRSHPKRQLFAYAGLLRCGNCNGGVTAEEHYNRHGYHYIYYHCTHKPNAWCKERSIEEEELQRQILAFIERISLDKEQTEEALAIVNKQREEETSTAAMKQSLEKALGMCRKSLDNLTQLRCRELITDEEFVRQRAELAKEQETHKERLRHLETSDWFEPSQNLFLFSNRAKFWLLHGTTEEKRIILSTISSNLFLKDKKIIIDAKKPFSILAERTQNSLLCTAVNGVRTFFQSEPGISIPELRSPEESVA